MKQSGIYNRVETTSSKVTSTGAWNAHKAVPKEHEHHQEMLYGFGTDCAFECVCDILAHFPTAQLSLCFLLKVGIDIHMEPNKIKINVT